MEDKTQNLNLPLLLQGQLSKDLVVNEAFLRIDCMLNTCLETLSPYKTPPRDLADGKLVLTSHDAESSFKHNQNQITFYTNGWRFIKPNEGLILWVKDEKKAFVFNGEKFQPLY